MIFSILLLASQWMTPSYASTAHCTDADLAALDAAEEAGQMGEQLPAVISVATVSGPCQTSEEAADRVLDVFNRACNFHRLPSSASSELPLFPMLANSKSSPSDCQDGVSVVNALQARRGLTAKEQTYARALNLGTLVPFSQVLTKLSSQGANLCSSASFSDQNASSVFELVGGYAGAGPGTIEPFSTHQAQLTGYFQQAIGLTPQVQLRYLRSLLVSNQFGFGPCSSPQPQNCCPPAQQ